MGLISDIATMVIAFSTVVIAVSLLLKKHVAVNFDPLVDALKFLGSSSGQKPSTIDLAPLVDALKFLGTSSEQKPSAPTEPPHWELERSGLLQRIDALRMSESTLRTDLKKSVELCDYYTDGGDLRRKIVDEKIEELKPLVGHRVDFAQVAIDMLQTEGDLIDLRSSSQ